MLYSPGEWGQRGRKCGEPWAALAELAVGRLDPPPVFPLRLQEPQAKPLFKSTKSLPTVDTSAQAAPQTYAEYVMSRPPGGPEASCPTGSETLAGETCNQALKPGAKSNSIIVSPRQRGNPVLKFVRNVPWEFGDVIPDYVLGQSTCALFLSLRYHNLHPDYIHERLQNLGKNFALRVLLIQVDVKDPQQALKELAKMCILADCTLILAWSPEEAGRYLETYKAYEQKPADLLMEKLEQDFVSRVTECLTTVKSVNKTDSQTLLTTFGSLEQLIAASREDLALCPGLGPQKVRALGKNPRSWRKEGAPNKHNLRPQSFKMKKEPKARHCGLYL
ncbi:DNA excision repair protein ERCC-1 isoform X2 [Callithrix jacchus]|uniref:DNA excision repair protein ERCC-1 isoform X5 n=1 Tax=Callithrix jacchus TaxID=9483 RepID=UPI00159E50A3|nr:DNA excision repair protein ERCC-1 isoform X5 [Callithrix jacchus]